jgi:hypothetical protein
MENLYRKLLVDYDKGKFFFININNVRIKGKSNLLNNWISRPPRSI